MRNFSQILLILIVGIFAEVELQMEEPSKVPYCFKFTWLGPNSDKDEGDNKTCADLTKGANVPCVLPIKDNPTLPNITEMWMDNENRTDHSCEMSGGNVCVKYTFYYNKAVENITFMCSKVSIENEGSRTSGCYTEYQNAREIEVCLCQSNLNDVPCNTGNTPSYIRLSVIAIALFNLFLYNYQS